MEKKPFIFGVATSGDNFTDREKETSRLVLNFRHGVNTVLISPRRWGKTSLVQKAVATGISMTHLLPPFSNKPLQSWMNGWSMPNYSFRVSALKYRWGPIR